MKPRIGFLGLGWIGRHRMAAMLADGRVEAAAIAEPDVAALAEAFALAPGAAVVPDLDGMLALGLDGVVIATPSAMHAGQTITALAAGCAVFCQKPLGRDETEARAAVDAARAADRLLAVDLSYRHTAAAAAARRELAQIGPIDTIELVFHNAYGPGKPWFYDRAQSGGGCLIDLGVHLLDLALWLLDWPAVESVEAMLSADGRPLAADAVEDRAVALLRLATGGTVSLACSWRLPAGQEAVIAARLFGRDGGILLENVGGSFYDFTAERTRGTSRHRLASPPDDWGGRAGCVWASRLAEGARFDEEAEHLVEVARLLDRILAAGCRP